MLLAACLLCSCESSFSLKLDETADKILVEAYFSQEDTTFLHFHRAVGFNGAKKASDDISMTKVEMSIGGVPADVVRMSDTRWYTLAKLGNRSERIVLSAQAENTASVSASTTVPDAPEVSAYGLDMDEDEFGSYLRLDIEMPEVPSEDSFFAVAVMKEVTYSRGNWSDTRYYSMEPTMRTLDNTLLANLWGGNYITFFYPDKVGEFDNCRMTVFGGSEFVGKTYSYYMTPGKDGLQDDGQTMQTTRYKAFFFRITADFYNYQKAKYSAENNRLAGAGFCPPNFSYSNVNGGYGIFAGLSWVETEWMDNIH